ncbi:hypothetical protein B0H14DRAFT_2609585 [Mycena olivaceomarginata]|nr:hypothetical protein B0H14DRAFT_2609585 [Mycena olivaceomarginata]
MDAMPRIPKSVPKTAAAPKSPHENSAASESTPMPTETPLPGHARVDKTIWSVYEGDPSMLRNIPDPDAAPPPNIHEAQMGRSKKIQLQFLEPRSSSYREVFVGPGTSVP